MPWAVPSATGGASSRGTSATTCSPDPRPRYWSERVPAASCTELPGTEGRSTGEKRIRRPAEVTAPTSPRVVVSTAERIASCFERRDGGNDAAVLRVGGELGSHHATGRRQEDAARRVGDLQFGCGGGGAGTRCDGPAVEEQRAPGVPYVSAAASSSRATWLRSSTSLAEQLLELGDLGLELVALGLELDPRESREPAQAQFEDVLRLEFREVEDVHQAGAGLFAVVRCADDLDDLVDVEDRDQQTLDEVQALLAPREAEEASPRDDLDAVVEVHPQQLAQAERLRLPGDEGDVVDAERVLERGQPVEVIEDGLRVEPGLDPDDEAQAVVAVGQVGDVRDALQLLGLHRILDLLDDPLGADEVRQLRDDEPRTSRTERLDRDLGARAERPAAGRVGVLDPVEADDDAARGEVWAGHELHELFERRLGVLEQMRRRRRRPR